MSESRNAHVCQVPLLMDAKVSPSGADNWPYSSLPQHTAAPSFLRPQVCLAPLLIDLSDTPSGGDDSP